MEVATESGWAGRYDAGLAVTILEDEGQLCHVVHKGEVSIVSKEVLWREVLEALGR